MASAQMSGVYRIYMVSPSGGTRLIAANGSYWWAPGGSSSGVIANTPEKWSYLPLSKERGVGGYKIMVTYQGAAATSDASDGFWSIPIICNGNAESLGNAANASGIMSNNFTTELTPADVAYVANTETPVQVVRAKENIQFQIGGGRVFLSIEDNA
jgi:hypothetical protein